MIKPYDIATVVSRSYISEQLQDRMQRNPEQSAAAFQDLIQKQSDKKNNVSRADKVENKKVAEKKERDATDEKNRKKRSKPKDPNTTIDIQA